jgi:hypothetical protein
MRGIEDVPTDALLDAMRQMPLSDFRRKELNEAFAKDTAEHRKTFRIDQPLKAPKEVTPMDPAQLLAGMSYSKAPKGAAGGDTSSGLRVRPSQRAPEQGDPLGPMRVAKPDLPDSEMRVYEGFKIENGDGQAQAEEG